MCDWQAAKNVRRGVQIEVVRRNLLHSLAAVVIGNVLYFVLLCPVLPPAGRHGIARIDLGLLIDFWICLVVYGVIALALRARKARAGMR